MDTKEYALYRVEDEDNKYFVDAFYYQRRAVDEAKRLFMANPEFCYEIEARRVIFSISKKGIDHHL